MADLGVIAMLGGRTKSIITGMPLPPFIGADSVRTMGTVITRPAERYQSLVVGSQRYALGGEDLAEGYTASPCLRMDAKGSWRFRWALTIGQHSISVFVKQAANLSPRPSLVVKSNTEIGIPADIEVFAASSTDWIQISSGTFSVTAVGVTWVELKCNVETNVGFSPCYWDLISKT